MNQQEFDALASRGYSHIPVVHEILADLDTPLSAYLKVADAPYSYLFESAGQGGEMWGRYSIIGLPARTVLRVRGRTVTVEEDGAVVEKTETDDPLAFIEAFSNRFHVPDLADLPRFFGGLVGYFGYDTIRYVEKRLAHSAPPDDLGTPDMLLMVSSDVIVFDNVAARMKLISLVEPSRPDAWQTATERLEARARQLDIAVPRIAESTANQPIEESDFESAYGRDRFMDAVERIREYIKAGDVMQVVLSQRMSIPFASPPINLYRALRGLNPSPYMVFMNLDDFHIVSSSPEILARVEHGTIVNRPLAGTRRRGHTDAEDRAMEEELVNDPKEIAEHLMLIDLGRNDVGRVSKVGSVKVTEQFVVERYSHVMHLSSNVVGELTEGKTAIDVLRATLPVGTLSGAPKIRAMEIIDELEPVKRGVYGGAVGYLAWNGNMDTAIAIRTALVKDGTLYIQAGGGVVADSIARLEWKESMNKGRAIFRAARMAEMRFRELE
ncbi:MAG: anthranilate synthase component I [Gammaproteobacteria bacterium]|nr:anthranilate synthase component I [Gammaproteobacteria bacterium]